MTNIILVKNKFHNIKFMSTSVRDVWYEEKDDIDLFSRG